MKVNSKKVRNVFIAILPLFLLLQLLGLTAQGQEQSTVTGKVTFEDGSAAPGVTVKVKDTNTGTSTDAAGNYQLKVPANATLVFSQLGMAVQEIPVGSRAIINVVLKEDVSQLNEVVVVGYGTQKKVNLSGAVAQIDGKDLQNKPVPNVTSALQGALPGVTVLRGTGQPGQEGYGIRIRGFSSANGQSALVLVDGVEQDLNLLDPNDIETISVLKDASASAIYGARAAGGVILVTTKQGAAGKTKLNFNSYYGVNITARQPQRLNSWDEQTLINEARLNATGKAEFNDEQIEWLKNPNFTYRPNPTQDRWEYYGNNNWVKEGMDKINGMKNYSLSLTGGEQKLNYLVSGSYYYRDGILRYGPDDNSRTNLKVNVNAILNKNITLKFNGGYIGSLVRENSYGTDQIINRLYRSRTRQLLYTPPEDVTGQIYNGDLQINAVDIEKNAGVDSRNYETFTGRLNLTVKDIVKGLNWDIAGWRNQNSYNRENDRRSLYWYGRSTNTVRFSANVPNSVSITKNRGYQNNLQSYFTYNLQVNKKHNFKLLAGASYEEYSKDEITTSANNLITNDFFSINFVDPLSVTSKDNNGAWALASGFGRFNYNYLEKYLFEASFRYDGSSRLAPENRWQFYPSFSAAWRLSEENFLKNKFQFLSNLKLRGSYGELGNSEALGLYDFIPLLTSGLTTSNNLVFNDQKAQYLYQGSLPSSTLTWENVQQTDLGVDMGFLKERLTVTADYYVKYNKNMLAFLNLPNIIGIGVSAANIGELKSWGSEFDIRWRDQIKKFSYHVGFNISDNQNELVKYDGKNSIGSGGVVSLLQGYPLNTVWGYKTAGYFQTQAEADAYKANVKYSFTNVVAGPGDVKYLDLNGDGVVNFGAGTPEDSGDLVYLGTTNARYTYGMDLGFSWKGFDFSVFLQGAAKRKFLINQGTLSPILGTADEPWTIHMNRWTPDNPNALFPRMYQTSAHNYQPSDKWAQNGSYLRLKNLQVGYTIPLKKTFMRSLKVYASGQDLWEKTDVLSVFDPEVGNDVSATTYPFYRTISFGLNVIL